MKLTQEIDYAFRIVAHLAANEGEVVGAPKIAEVMEIPERFTLRILRKLNLGGLTRSKRGAKGGYSLNRPAESISLYDIILAIDGPIELNNCLHANDPYCNRFDRDGIERCKFHRSICKVQHGIIDELKGMTITDYID
ncbi:MAG: Rrf2 family transcriptional regulator [Peptoniphilus sp.]|nr:Rrf2 family transcriptional regulator [Peptoniphilus sp.]MDD7362779.1 Rrf2 family transcriptional regulator [Bacillota bacterium]MDY6044029.1 Rrf2 family transcriptional regulator [Peptoniphilus sp.]